MIESLKYSVKIENNKVLIMFDSKAEINIILYLIALKLKLITCLKITVHMKKAENSLVRPNPETQLNLTQTRPRPHFGCTWPKIYTRRVDQVLNSRPGSGSGCPPGRQELGLACFPTRYTHELACVSP